MVGRIVRVALAVVLVVTSLPVSVFAQQASGAQREQSERAQVPPAPGLESTSSSVVSADLSQTTRHLDWQHATSKLVVGAQTPLRQTLRQTTSGGGGLFEVRGTKLLIYLAVIGGVAYSMYALEGISPKPSSANEK